MTSVPRAAAASLWLNAWLRGSASADDVRAALGSEHQVVVGLCPEPLAWTEALAMLRRSSSTVCVALTAPGDPLGLAGPPGFNAVVMEAGEALVLPEAGFGLIPVRVGGAVEWRALPAQPPVRLDPREARHHLRQVLREVTEELVDLQIASWNNEIPDLLMNRAQPVRLPRDLPVADHDAVTSASLCLAILEAAGDAEPGAISAWEFGRFEEAMRRLDRAARRALVAVCGPMDGRLR